MQYADDNTLNAMNKKLHVVRFNLEANFYIMQRWFYENHMAINLRKCHCKRFFFVSNIFISNARLKLAKN